jgi:hypothetical protein
MTTTRRLQAVHEAGHAVVAMATGMHIHSLRIEVPEGDPILKTGGGYCLNYSPAERWRSKHSIMCLAGVLACSIHCRDYPELEEHNSWAWCHEDMRLFNADRNGMTYRQARRMVLAILRAREAEVLELAAILERDGIVTIANAPESMRSTSEEVA